MPTIELPRNVCIVSSDEEATSLHVPHDISTEDLFDLATATTLIKVLRDFGLVQHRRRSSISLILRTTTSKIRSLMKARVIRNDVVVVESSSTLTLEMAEHHLTN